MKKFYSHFLIIFSFTLLFLIFLKEFYNDFPTNDSSIYITYGNLIADGKLLYKDLFDNKGPTIFFINLLGSIISYKSTKGVLLLELILFLSMIYFVSKFIFLDRYYKFLLLSLLVLSYVAQFYGGNLDTTWFLIFATPVYIFFFSYVTQMYKLSSLQRKLFSIYFGICFSFIFFLKFNYLFGLSIILLFYLLENKKYLPQIVIFFSIGTLITLLVLYFGLFLNNPNFINDIFKSYFFFNSQYAFQHNYSDNIIINTLIFMLKNLRDFFKVFYKEPIIIFILISLLMSQIIFKKEFYQKKLYIVLIILCSDGISLILAPVRQASLLYIVPSLLIFQYLLFQRSIKVKKNYILFFLIFSIYFNQNIFTKTHNDYDIKLLDNLKKRSDIAQEFKALAICGFTTGSIWFLKTNLESLSKFYFTPLLNNRKYLGKLYKNYYNIIKYQKPNYIFINPYCYQEDLLISHLKLINSLGYSEIFKIQIKDTKMFNNTRVFYLSD